MTKVTAQAVNLNFCPGMGSTFINSKSMERMPARLQDVLREAMRKGSAQSSEKLGIAMNEITGDGPNPTPESNYQQLKATMRDIRLTEAEMDTFRERGAVERNAAIYSDIRKKLDEIAGLDVFGAVSEYEKKVRGKPLNPQKWWA